MKKKHGHYVGGRPTRTYRIWTGMLTRCRNKNVKEYKYYGGRGINVCERWLSFENFLEDMGEVVDGMSLDRIDNNGNYCKDNCRWATEIQQHRNRSDNKIITYNGRSMSISAWAELIGIDRHTLADRIRKSKWSIEKSLTHKVMTKSDIAKQTNNKRWGS